MEKISLSAFAKINLTLDITGRRDDGYHEIESIMQSVSLADDVTVEKTGEGGIRFACSCPKLPQGPENLAYRAAEAFFAAAGLQNPGVSIAVTKKIPLAAGLAGGSADAAAVLTGLNALFGRPLDEAALAAAGLRLGADVPFCLSGGTRLARGVGECLTVLPALYRCLIVIAKPDASVSTAAAYAAFDGAPQVRHPETARAVSALEKRDLPMLAGSLGNVFEEVTGGHACTQAVALMCGFGALGACLSGSGPSVYGLFDDPATASACLMGLKNIYRKVFLCRPVARGIENAEPAGC